MLRLAGVALLGWAAPAHAACESDATCGPEEDASMVQLRGVRGQASSPEKRSFALNSKPFINEAGEMLSGAEAGEIVIDEDGVENTYYLPGATTIDGGKTVKFLPPWRFYLMKTPTTNYSKAEDFYKPAFLGKTFSVDIDFGRDGPSCGCNLNFYLVDMPVSFPGKDKDYYCDAQCFEGLGCCAEFDMNEGNMNVQQVTNHACTEDYEGHPDWICSKWGNPWAKTHTSDFSIGPGHKIDSTKPFTYAQKFEMDGDVFTFTTTMSQEGKEVVLRLGPGNDQMNAMAKVLERGMAFVTGYWFAEDMNWLDNEQCGAGPEHCNNHPAYISNWRITSNGNPVPSPPPAPPAPPSPEPAPVPVEGMCCWAPDCTSCATEPTNWCNKDSETCAGCSGTWCPRSD